MRKREKWAYMTLEASLIIPMVLGGIVFILYIGFYLYNSCAIKQAAYIAALRGSQVKNASSDEIEKYVEQQLDDLLSHQILAKGNIEKEIKVSIWKVKVKINTDIKMPLAEWLSSITNLWKIEGEAEASRVDPIEIIRGARKLNGSQISE